MKQVKKGTLLLIFALLTSLFMDNKAAEEAFSNLSLQRPSDADFRDPFLLKQYRGDINTICVAAKEVIKSDSGNVLAQLYCEEQKRIGQLKEESKFFDDEVKECVRLIVAAVDQDPEVQKEKTKKVVVGAAKTFLSEQGVCYDDGVNNTPEGHQLFIKINGTVDKKVLPFFLPGAFFVRWAIKNMVEEESD